MKRMSFEERLEAKNEARLRREDKQLARLDRQMEAANRLIGELSRGGRTVYYVSPVGGKYREGSRVGLIQFLIRNKYCN